MTRGGREQVLSRIAAALGDRPGVPPDRHAYHRRPGERGAGLLALLVERLEDYGAGVVVVRPEEAADAIAAICSARGSARVVVPPDLPAEWVPPGVEVVADPGLTAHELDALDGVVTGCALAVATTGTIALDGGVAQGRRALTLVPDHHVCVIRADQVVADIPDAIEVLRPAVVGARRPVTLISGPSATSDIELRRVAGVHGPRRLDAVILSS